MHKAPAMARMGAVMVGSVLLVSLLYSAPAECAWTRQQVERITTAIQAHDSGWTFVKTVGMLREASTSSSYQSGVFSASGRLVPIIVQGETVLVNGKDVSGNLGSKTTHGDNSPILENVSNSAVATGERATASNEQSWYSVSIAINVGLTLMLALSLAWNWRLRVQLRRK